MNGELKIGFIGFGEAGFHLARGLCDAGLSRICAYDLNANTPGLGEKIRQRATESKVSLLASNAELVASFNAYVKKFNAANATDIEAKMRALRVVGLPYTDEEIKAAPVKPVDKTVRTATPVKQGAEPEEQIASIPAGAYRIQLGSVSSEGQASKFWSAQREKNGDLLGKLALNVEKTSVGGKVFYRIQAGPMKDAASARVLCDQLKQRQIGCIIVNPKK